MKTAHRRFAMGKIFLNLAALLCIAVISAQDFETFKPAQREKVLFSCGFETPDIPGALIRNDCSIVREAGVNGNTGFVIERKSVPLEKGIWSTFDIPNTVPGITYRVEASVRQEGMTKVKPRLNFFACMSVESRWKDTGKGVPWMDGTTHFVTKGLSPEYKNIQFRFTAGKNMKHFLVLRLQAGWTGKIFYDDIRVVEEGVQNTILLTWPATHSFEPGDSQFILHGDQLPHGCLVQAKLVRNGKELKSLILKPDVKGDFTGDWGEIEPGEAEMKVFAAVPDTKVLTFSQVFPVRFLKNKRSEKAVTLDRYGRLIVNGTPFLPIGLSTSFHPRNGAWYKRISNGGFNLVSSTGMLRSTHRDPAHYFDTIKAGLDLIHKHGLYSDITTTILLDYYRYRIKKIGNAVTVNEKLEAVVNALGKHPAILYYYDSDEVPEAFMDQVLTMRNTLNRLDPDHPVMALSNDPKLLPKFAQLGDIFCYDSYPIGMKTAPRDLKRIQEFMVQARRSGVPVWGYVQAFNWGHYRGKLTPEKFAEFADPSAEEIRSMIFLYAIEGVRGFLFYTDPMSQKIRNQSVQYNVPSHPERMWQNLLPAVRDLKSVESFILGKRGPTRLSLTKQKGKCAAALFENDRGKRAVLIVAVSGKEAECEFTVPGEPSLRSRFGKTENLGGGRYRFKGTAASSDILENQVMEM